MLFTVGNFTPPLKLFSLAAIDIRDVNCLPTLFFIQHTCSFMINIALILPRKVQYINLYSVCYSPSSIYSPCLSLSHASTSSCGDVLNLLLCVYNNPETPLLQSASFTGVLFTTCSLISCSSEVIKIIM